MPLYQPPDVNAPVLSQFSLKGKIAAVTGGARGIGLEIVRGLAEAGADVALIYRTSLDAPQIAEQISKATGSRVQAFQGDVVSRAPMAQLFKEIRDGFGNGRLDIAVANAGITADIPALEYDEKTWAANNAVNLDGVMWTAQAAANIFKEQGKGNLIVTASISATVVNIPQKQAVYNASKAAVAHLTKCLAVEWIDFARVNCISPGYVQTDMLRQQPAERLDKWTSLTPGGRLCQPAELKSAYVFLASDACCFMTGAEIIIDGGLSLI